MGGNATWWEKQDRNKSTRAMPCLQPHSVPSLELWDGITAAHCLASGLQHQWFGERKVMPFQGWTSVNHSVLGTVWVLSQNVTTGIRKKEGSRVQILKCPYISCGVSA